jgi:hypothetical protein
MAPRAKVSFTRGSSALVLSIIAFPVSVVAFAVLYANNDAFWATAWLGGVVPIICVVAAALAIRDAVKRRSWREIVGVVALLTPSFVLAYSITSPRFLRHRLFLAEGLRSRPLPYPRVAVSQSSDTTTREPEEVPMWLDSDGDVVILGDRWVPQSPAWRTIERGEAVRCGKKLGICALAESTAEEGRAFSTVSIFTVNQWTSTEIDFRATDWGPCRTVEYRAHIAKKTVDLVLNPGPSASASECSHFLMSPEQKDPPVTVRAVYFLSKIAPTR